MRHPIFTISGLALIGAASLAEFYGWAFSNATHIRGVPKSVRDNPGVYRSIYSGYSRYSGGK